MRIFNNILCNNTRLDLLNDKHAGRHFAHQYPHSQNDLIMWRLFAPFFIERQCKSLYFAQVGPRVWFPVSQKVNTREDSGTREVKLTSPGCTVWTQRNGIWTKGSLMPLTLRTLLDPLLLQHTNMLSLCWLILFIAKALTEISRFLKTASRAFWN